jgi:LEA14-like dessication related protein
MRKYVIRVSWVLVLLLAGCETLSPNYETPTLTVTGIKALPAQGFEQPFEIGLKLLNPNPVALSLNGMSYQLIIEGHKLAQGVSNNIPSAPAYGSTDFTVEVSTNLFKGLKLVHELMQNPRETVSYELVAKLDIGWVFLPKLSVTEKGEINFSKP